MTVKTRSRASLQRVCSSIKVIIHQSLLILWIYSQCSVAAVSFSCQEVNAKVSLALSLDFELESRAYF